MGKGFKFFEYRNGRVFVSSEGIFLIFLVLFLVLFLMSAKSLAISLNCDINANSTCSGIFVWYQENDTGGFSNAHAQNVTNSGFRRYNYGVCCYSESTLTNDCSDAIVLKLANLTNSHVQVGNYSGSIIYNYSLCLSAYPGRVLCRYEKNSGSSCLSPGYTCLASIASSEASAANITNAHVGPCSEYEMKVCCKVNEPSLINWVVLNTTSPAATNYTDENLTVYFNQTGVFGEDIITNITDWRKNDISINVLNMPFNTFVNTTASGAVKDYSTYSNNGTLGGGVESNKPTWTASGKIGGAYQFDGVNDYISLSGLEVDTRSGANTTVSFWMYWNGQNAIMPFGWQSAYNLLLYNGCFGFNTAESNVLGISSSGLSNKWVHVVAVFYNGVPSSTTNSLYINGVKQNIFSCLGSTTASRSVTSSAQISGWAYGSGYYFNGTIDEVQIFNYSLSENQIKVMYQAGVENHSVQVMHSDETKKGENWSVEITSNEALSGDTDKKTSNVLRIRNKLPSIILTSPEDGAILTNRTPLFNWSVYDADGDAVTSQFNATSFSFRSPDKVCSQNILKNSSTNNVVSDYLLCFWDRGYQYLWSVRGYDGEGFGEWASYRRFNLTAIVDTVLTRDSVNFGTIPLLSSENTSDDSPLPLVIRNDGNCFVHTNISATDLFSRARNPTPYYKFKIDNVPGEEGAFDYYSSLINWTNVFNSTSNNTIAIYNLNFTDATDSAEIDIFAQVPGDEPPGNKTSLMTLMSALSE